MNIALDITPLSDNRLLSHRVRGTGFYLQNLKNSLVEFFPDNKYQFFKKGDRLDEATDLVHYPYFEPFFLTLPLNKSHKTIVTVHDLTPLVFPKQFPSGIKGNIKWQIQKLNLQRVDRIITDSNCSKEDIAKFAGVKKDKIDVVYLAAGKEFTSIKNKELSIKTKDKYKLPEKFVLYVGDVTWNKNLPRLIKAVGKINVPLVMVGKSLLEAEFDKTNPWNQDLVKTQELIAQNPDIHALGFVPTEDLVALYNLATAFVMPSLYEGFGLPILEAMASGCPVITSRAGSLLEVAGDAAFFVDAEDIDSIADGINEVFENTNQQTDLSERGLVQAKKFSWKKTAADTLKAYRQVIK
jgi:glycosyltransferase involved in cell wall biosynthesis